MRTVDLAGRCPKRFRRTTLPPDVPAAQSPDLVRRLFLNLAAQHAGPPNGTGSVRLQG